MSQNVSVFAYNADGRAVASFNQDSFDSKDSISGPFFSKEFGGIEVYLTIDTYSPDKKAIFTTGKPGCAGFSCKDVYVKIEDIEGIIH